jgi:bla regulator protein blaR1
MEFYILKSGICLAIFYGFYKLVLEKESFHVFKRFYLLGSVVLAFSIPLITFTEYIEVVPQEVPLFFPESSITNSVIEAEPTNYMPIILWSIYGFGVLLFSLKFLKNLSGIIIKIKRNPKFKNQSFIHVLLQDLVIPHTFLSYIFLNKHKFETQQIPKEVLLHEETHAKQKHSLDVLFIEILQILFWFNPIIYFFKHSIKLNHEFLADQAVLKKGTEPLKYQSLLLAFSSNALEPQLANAINYSSIKKRLTVMETHTSKKAIWLRALILLPLLAILIYSFSEKQVVEKEAIEPYIIQQNTKESNTVETNPTVNPQQLKETLNYNILILINDKGQLLVNDFIVEINNLKNSLNDLTKNLTHEQKDNIIINLKSHEEAPKKVITKVNNILRELKFMKHDLGQTYIYNEPLNPKSATPEETEHLNEILKKISLNTKKNREIEQSDLNFIKYMYDKMTEEQKVADEPLPKNQQKATPEEIKEYNDLIKKFTTYKNEKQIYSLEDLNRSSSIFKKISEEQKANMLEMPVMPPSPMPPFPTLPKNPSKELIELKTKFDEKSNGYYELVNVYFSGKEIDAKKLWSFYDDSLKLYYDYSDLAKKERESSKD